MKNEMQQPDDEVLRKIVRQARPTSELPVGFSKNVWRRIESADVSEAAPQSEWLDRVVGWLLRPRFALASIAIFLILGGSIGAMDGVQVSKRAAEYRYVASVNPAFLGK